MAERVSDSFAFPEGFYAAGGACGIKASGLPDMALIVADRPCAAAGAFTRSRTVAAPVTLNRRHLRGGTARAIVCNSGNANAATGQQGESDAISTCRLMTEYLSANAPAELRAKPLRPREMLVASTGVIGHPLPMDRIEAGIDELTAGLSAGPTAAADAARAILTTDLASKTASRQVKLGHKTVTIAGLAKGSGMIAPNMATMLSFIVTDAAIETAALHAALGRAVQQSFNRISVDQHTSPSDMALALANGAAGGRPMNERSRDYSDFEQALTDLCRDLAHQIVKDGEGATRVFRLRVTGARTEREADRVGKAVVDSPLVKTAVHGADPNWGRIVTAAGYSGATIQPAKMSLAIGDANAIRVYEGGTPVALSQSELDRLASVMRQKEVTFHLDLGRGEAAVEWLGCDLSRQYITINADYTT